VPCVREKEGCLRSVFVFRESRLLPNKHHVTQVWLDLLSLDAVRTESERPNEQ